MLTDLGLLSLRLVIGLLLVGHGAQKLFGWFGGNGLKGMTQFTTKLGLWPASFWAFMAGLSEFGGGLLLLLGFLSPVGALGIAAPMLVAVLVVHWQKGLWASKGGGELPLVNLVAALALGLTGPGLFSLDALLGIALPEPLTLIAGIALVVLGVLVALLSAKLHHVQQPAAPVH
jgi:putative oxidoreductase